MRYLLTILLCVSFCSTILYGQNDRDLYDYFFEEGERFLDFGFYQKANRLFKAAEISTNDPKLQREALIKVIFSDSVYVRQLQEAEQAATEARDQARASEKSARAAQADAQIKKRFSDALYLAFIADKEVTKYIADTGRYHRDSVVMQLAKYGVDLIANDAKYERSVHTVFGRAIYNATRLLLPGHNKSIHQIAINSDGSFYTQGRDNVILYRDNASSQRSVNRLGDFIQDMQVHNDGEIVVAIERESNTVNIRRKPFNEDWQRVSFDKRINRVLFHPGQNYLCVALQDGPLQFINLDSPKIPRIADHGGTWVRDVRFSSDSTMIVSRGANGSIGVWQPDGSVITAPFKAHDQYVYGAMFSPDGQKILTHSADQTAKMWDLDGNILHTLAYHQNPVFKAEYARDGKHLLTFSIGNDVVVWAAESGQFIAEMAQDIPFSVERIQDAMFHPDNQSVLTVSDTSVQRVNFSRFPTSVTQSFSPGGAVHGVDISANGHFLLTYGDDHRVSIWDLNRDAYEPGDAEGHLLMEVALISEEELKVTAATFSPDSDRVYVGMSNGIVQIVPLPHVVLRSLAAEPIVFYYDLDGDFMSANNLDEILPQFRPNWRERGFIDIMEIRN